MRLHEPRVRALVGVPRDLRAPMPGWFIPAIGAGDLVRPDGVIGQLVVLGRVIAVLAGDAHGLAGDPGPTRAVAYGDPIVALDGAAGSIAAASPIATPLGGVDVFRAPTSGRFYGRSSPDKPPFANIGCELVPGATVCLLEVMKTFHRVTYAGEPVRVRAVLVRDGDDVNAGDPLLALESR